VALGGEWAGAVLISVEHEVQDKRVLVQFVFGINSGLTISVL